MGNSKALLNFLFAVWFFQLKLQKYAIVFLVFAEQVQTTKTACDILGMSSVVSTKEPLAQDVRPVADPD